MKPIITYHSDKYIAVYQLIVDSEDIQMGTVVYSAHYDSRDSRDGYYQEVIIPGKIDIKDDLDIEKYICLT